MPFCLLAMSNSRQYPPFLLSRHSDWVQNTVIYICKVPWGHAHLLAFTQHSSSSVGSHKEQAELSKEHWICISYHIDFTTVFIWDIPCTLSLDLKQQISNSVTVIEGVWFNAPIWNVNAQFSTCEQGNMNVYYTFAAFSWNPCKTWKTK